jgi:hypothetical protein
MNDRDGNPWDLLTRHLRADDRVDARAAILAGACDRQPGGSDEGEQAQEEGHVTMI